MNPPRKTFEQKRGETKTMEQLIVIHIGVNPNEYRHRQGVVACAVLFGGLGRESDLRQTRETAGAGHRLPDPVSWRPCVPGREAAGWRVGFIVMALW